MKRVITSLILTAAVIAPSLAQAHHRDVVVVREIVRPVSRYEVVTVVRPRHEWRPHYYSESDRWEYSRRDRDFRHADWRDGYRGAYTQHVGWGDRDGDGIPNRYDNRPNNPRGDQDRDGIPNRWDNRPLNPHGDQDRDGVPNRFDRKPVDYRRN